jgi:hypothetical protein
MKLERGVHLERTPEQLVIGKPFSVLAPIISVLSVAGVIVYLGARQVKPGQLSHIPQSQMLMYIASAIFLLILASAGAVWWSYVTPKQFFFTTGDRILRRGKKTLCRFDDITRIQVRNLGAAVDLALHLANEQTISIERLPMTISYGRWRPIDELAEVGQAISEVTGCKEVVVNRIPPTQLPRSIAVDI